jgi:hypothetical protein
MNDKLIKNTSDLRKELAVLFENVKKGHIKAFDAKEMTNMAGKMINSAKLDLEYAIMQRKITGLKIDFLEK